MGNIFKIKRRTTGSAGAPATIAHGELAFNEVGEAFYYGKASNASSAIGGKGEFLDKSTSQTVAGNKTFTSNVVLSSAVTITQVTTATDTYIATTEFVQNVFSVLDGGNFDDAGGGGGGGSSFDVTYNGPANTGFHAILLGFDPNNWPAGVNRFAIQQTDDNFVSNINSSNTENTTIIEYNYVLPLMSPEITAVDANIYLRVIALDGDGSMDGEGNLVSGNILATSNTIVLNITNGVITLVSDGNGGGGNSPVTGQYYYSASSSDWYTVSNWWGDSSHTQQATTLPLSSTNVVIVNGSVEPVVSLDNANWVQPASIDSGSVGITFTSQNFGNVTCSISGEATFEGNSTYNV
jgi:hypothetical protein